MPSHHTPNPHNFPHNPLLTLTTFFLLLLSSISLAILNPQLPSKVFQGKSFVVLVNSEEVKSCEAIFDGSTYNFYDSESGLRAIIPTTADQKVGSYKIKIKAYKSDKTVEEIESSIKIAYKKYKTVSFTIPKSRKKLLQKELVNRDWEGIEAKLKKESPLQLWEGLFVKPVGGVTTMPYGTFEFVNGQKRSYHKGWDLRAAVGTDVLAPNSGIIVYADFPEVFGGTVVVDHGQGVNTMIFHLSKIFVKEGEFVSKGDKLALSGNTGVSSGPHVHWGLSVHNVRVAPEQWVLEEL